MSNEIENLELIDQYLQGKMSEVESEAFGQKIMEDKEFAKLVEKQSAINLLVIEAGLDDIRNLMRKDISTLTSKKTTSTSKWLGGGLLVVVGIIGISYLNHSPENKESENLTSKQLVKEVVEGEASQPSTYIESQKKEKKVQHLPEKSNETVVAKEVFVQQTNTSLPKQDVKLKPLVVEAQNKLDEPKAELNSCLEFHPEVSFVTKPSLVNASNGEIRCISNEPDLKFKLSNQEASVNAIFANLDAGKYSIIVENAAGCKSTHNDVVVKTTYCIQNTKDSYNIALELEFEMPIAQSHYVDIVVYNKQMLQVASFNNVEQMRWDGRTNSGAIAETGLHKIEVKYKSGEHCFYSLTVFNQ